MPSAVLRLRAVSGTSRLRRDPRGLRSRNDRRACLDAALCPWLSRSSDTSARSTLPCGLRWLCRTPHHERAPLFRTTIKSVHRRLWPGVNSVGVVHSEPPVTGSRLWSLDRPQKSKSSDGPHENSVLVNAVGSVPARSGTETGSSVLNKRGPGRPERGRAE